MSPPNVNEERFSKIEMSIAALRSERPSLTELRLTMGQFITALLVTLGIFSIQMANAALTVAQFMLQNERTSTLTKSIDEVKKAQQMSDVKRVDDLKEIRQLIADQQKGTRR